MGRVLRPKENHTIHIHVSPQEIPEWHTVWAAKALSTDQLQVVYL